MASIWMQMPGRAERKVHGNLNQQAVLGLFKISVANAARENKAKIIRQTEMEAVLELPPTGDGELAEPGVQFALWVEPCSPPSAPEPGQPKLLTDGKGILVTKKGAFNLAAPVKL